MRVSPIRKHSWDLGIRTRLSVCPTAREVWRQRAGEGDSGRRHDCDRHPTVCGVRGPDQIPENASILNVNYWSANWVRRNDLILVRIVHHWFFNQVYEATMERYGINVLDNRFYQFRMQSPTKPYVE